MVQFARREDFGETSSDKLASGVKKLVERKLEAFEEKHDYERNLRLLKNLKEPDAERLAHLPRNLLEQHLGNTLTSGNNRFQDILMGNVSQEQTPYENNAVQAQSGDQSPSIQDQDALLSYLQTPQGQQEYTPEQAQTIKQGIAQDRQKSANPVQNMQATASPAQQQLSEAEKLILASGSPLQLNQAKAINELRSGKAAKLSPQNDRFIKHAETDVEFADEVLPLLDEVEEIVARGQYKRGPAEVLKAKIDPSLLTGDTQALHNTLQNLLTKQAAAETKGGRGSDLLRKMVAEGKLSIGQEPATLEKRLDAIRKDVIKKKHTASVAADIQESGKVPINLAEKVRSTVKAEQEKFDRLSDAKKVEFLLSNPKKLTYIRDIDYNGNVWVRDENNNWVRA